MVKLAFGDFGDSFSVGSIKSYLAEFIATLLFVFAGVGSAIAYGEFFIWSSMIYIYKIILGVISLRNKTQLLL